MPRFVVPNFKLPAGEGWLRFPLSRGVIDRIDHADEPLIRHGDRFMFLNPSGDDLHGLLTIVYEGEHPGTPWTEPFDLSDMLLNTPWESVSEYIESDDDEDRFETFLASEVDEIIRIRDTEIAAGAQRDVMKFFFLIDKRTLPGFDSEWEPVTDEEKSASDRGWVEERAHDFGCYMGYLRVLLNLRCKISDEATFETQRLTEEIPKWTDKGLENVERFAKVTDLIATIQEKCAEEVFGSLEAAVEALPCAFDLFATGELLSKDKRYKGGGPNSAYILCWAEAAEEARRIRVGTDKEEFWTTFRNSILSAIPTYVKHYRPEAPGDDPEFKDYTAKRLAEPTWTSTAPHFNPEDLFLSWREMLHFALRPRRVEA